MLLLPGLAAVNRECPFYAVYPLCPVVGQENRQIENI